MIGALPIGSSRNVELRVRDERLRLLYQHGPMTAATSALVAAVLLLWMHARVPAVDAIVWSALFAAVTAARFGLMLLHARRCAALAPEIWLRLFAIGALLAGCIWGATAIWLFPNSLLEQFFDLLICAGLAAGAATSLSCVPSVWALFTYPMLAIVALRLAMEAGTMPHIAALLAVVFGFALTVAARTNSRLLVTSLRLRFANIELAHELEALATRDALTGLANRLILVERLASALRRANRSNDDVAVVFVDCDGFKAVNDTYGHAAGDEYLKKVARALELAVRDSDTVARLGGDEFIILIERCGTRDALDRVVRRIHMRAMQPIAVGDQTIVPRLSVGVTCYAGDGTEGDALIRQADQAMYQAKRSGGNVVRFYDPTTVRRSG